MADEGAFDFGGADAVARDVEDVVDTADDPEVTVFVLTTTIAGEVAAGNFGPVDLFVAFGIAPEAAQHAGPGFADDEFAALPFRDGIALVIDDFGNDAEEWERGAAGFGGGGA